MSRSYSHLSGSPLRPGACHRESVIQGLSHGERVRVVPTARPPSRPPRAPGTVGGVLSALSPTAPAAGSHHGNGHASGPAAVRSPRSPWAEEPRVAGVTPQASICLGGPGPGSWTQRTARPGQPLAPHLISGAREPLPRERGHACLVGLTTARVPVTSAHCLRAATVLCWQLLLISEPQHIAFFPGVAEHPA